MAHSAGIRKLILGGWLLLWMPVMHAQSTFTLKYFGLTIHPFGDRTAELQPHKLDKTAHFVLNFGGYAGYEHFVYKDLVSLKVIQGVFTDCSGGWASVSHFGVRALLLETRKHRLYFGIGPTLLVRNSWERFGDKYQPSGYFETAHHTLLGNVQWKFIPYGCEFEYDYRWTERNQLSVSFTPGVPLACTFSVGWKHWISIKTFDYLKVYVPRK